MIEANKIDFARASITKKENIIDVLFRIFDQKNNRYLDNEEISSELTQTSVGHTRHILNIGYYRAPDYIVERSTTILDKNSNWIFEGDHVWVSVKGDSKREFCHVEYIQPWATFLLITEDGSGYRFEDCTQFDIAGTIHDEM